jgi:hypothetical protein
MIVTSAVVNNTATVNGGPMMNPTNQVLAQFTSKKVSSI